METISFHVNYKNTVYTYHSGTEAMIFDYGVNNEIDRKHGLKALTEYVSAHIHSLNGAMDEITVLGEDKKGNQPIYIVDYKGIKCTAIFNWFNCTYYADDKYGRLQ